VSSLIRSLAFHFRIFCSTGFSLSVSLAFHFRLLGFFSVSLGFHFQILRFSTSVDSWKFQIAEGAHRTGVEGSAGGEADVPVGVCFIGHHHDHVI